MPRTYLPLLLQRGVEKAPPINIHFYKSERYLDPMDNYYSKAEPIPDNLSRSQHKAKLGTTTIRDGKIHLYQ
ncbi:hypothetical protein V6N12_007515 [Hibiscus sabdariffa]|uniref:Uncharacterized protein n=1 Tax=Hibiscus sabdariffa TaxID=183260 RepID=A0ABR2F202_9ROSI